MTDMTNETSNQRETDRKNDNRLLTPLLLMALVIAGWDSDLRDTRPATGELI